LQFSLSRSSISVYTFDDPGNPNNYEYNDQYWYRNYGQSNEKKEKNRACQYQSTDTRREREEFEEKIDKKNNSQYSKKINHNYAPLCITALFFFFFDFSSGI